MAMTPQGNAGVESGGAGALPLHLSEAEVAALPAAADLTMPRQVRYAAWRVLAPLLQPLEVAGQAVGLAPIIRRTVKRAVVGAMHEQGTAYGAWDGPTWVAASRRAGGYAANVLAIAYHWGRVSGAEVLAADVQPTPFAWHVFDRGAVEGEVQRIRDYLRGIGYGPCNVARFGLAALLARLFIQAGRPALEAISLDVVEEIYRQAAPRGHLRADCFRLARMLHLMGLSPRALCAHPHLHAGDALNDVDPVWASWCLRWRATSTLSPASKQVIYYATLKAGRWLARHHPSVRTPDDWTRELASAYIAAIDADVVGTYNAPRAHQAARAGTPSPCGRRIA